MRHSTHIDQAIIPIQVTVSRECERVAKFVSRRISGCPRPEVGSFSHIAKHGIYLALVEYGIGKSYAKSLVWN
jgi:hypothetical protein